MFTDYISPLKEISTHLLYLEILEPTFKSLEALYAAHIDSKLKTEKQRRWRPWPWRWLEKSRRCLTLADMHCQLSLKTMAQGPISAPVLLSFSHSKFLSLLPSVFSSFSLFLFTRLNLSRFMIWSYRNSVWVEVVLY